MQPQPQKSSAKSYIIVTVVIVLALGAYFYLRGNPSDSVISSLQSSGNTESTEAMVAGAKILSLLNQINNIKIDSSIFTNDVYRTLVDKTIQIPAQNIGRINPFSPFPGMITTSVPKTR